MPWSKASLPQGPPVEGVYSIPFIMSERQRYHTTEKVLVVHTVAVSATFKCGTKVTAGYCKLGG